MSRCIIIGDVHGCFLELKALLRECEATDQDRLIFVGDLVAKGPDSRKVVRWARKHGAEAVRGNHDEHCLRWWRAHEAGASPPDLKAQHRMVVDALSGKDWRWLAALPLFIDLPEHNALVVHAGLELGIPPERQDESMLMNMRSIRANGTASRQIEDGAPWASTWPGPQHIYFGHDAVRGLQEYEFATGLDTGCVYGGRLTACILPSRELVSVAAERVWRTAGGSR